MQFDKFAAGRVIRRERKKKELSPESLSQLTIMARSHLSMIETGEKQANFQTIWRIAYALGMKPHELVKMIEEESEKERNDKAE